ncbi:MAG: hypothetical protein V1668_00720 [Patescibacteria group bacterium]
MSKKSIIIISLIGVVLAGTMILYFIYRSSVTGKNGFANCMATCYEIVLSDSSKQYCPEQCIKNTGYKPTGPELMEVVNKLSGKSSNANSAKSNANTNKAVSKNTNTVSNTSVALNMNRANSNLDPSREYYCNWVWPQEIIDRVTKELAWACTSERPWCNYADYSYEKAGCCTDTTYADCVTLPNLLIEN